MTFRDQILAVPDQIALRCDGKSARVIAGIMRVALEQVIRNLAENGWRMQEKLKEGGAR